MSADGAPKTPLEQFTTFVTDICPKLDAEVPSKYTALFAFYLYKSSPCFVIFFDE